MSTSSVDTSQLQKRHKRHATSIVFVASELISLFTNSVTMVALSLRYKIVITRALGMHGTQQWRWSYNIIHAHMYYVPLPSARLHAATTVNVCVHHRWPGKHSKCRTNSGFVWPFNHESTFEIIMSCTCVAIPYVPYCQTYICQ